MKQLEGIELAKQLDPLKEKPSKTKNKNKPVQQKPRPRQLQSLIMMMMMHYALRRNEVKKEKALEEEIMS